jgi:hypothetical protein
VAFVPGRERGDYQTRIRGDQRRTRSSVSRT